MEIKIECLFGVIFGPSLAVKFAKSQKGGRVWRLDSGGTQKISERRFRIAMTLMQSSPDKQVCGISGFGRNLFGDLADLFVELSVSKGE